MTLLRIMYWLAFKVGVYLWWSKLFRAIHHSAFSSIKVETGLSREVVAAKLSLLDWVRDTFWALGDAVGSPNWVQKCIDTVEAGGKQPGGGLDCDEFATWAAVALDPVYDPVVLNVFWKKGMLTGSGHHVCLYTTKGGFRHTGNWGDKGAFPSIDKAVLDVLKGAGRGPEHLVGYSTFHPLTLDRILYITSLPA